MFLDRMQARGKDPSQEVGEGGMRNPADPGDLECELLGFHRDLDGCQA